MDARQCPKWEGNPGCSAPICPLDADWKKRSHVEGESVCLYLRELAKPNGKQILESVLPEPMVEHICQTAPEIMARYGEIRRQCEKSSRSGSRIKRGQMLKGGGHGFETDKV